MKKECEISGGWRLLVFGFAFTGTIISLSMCACLSDGEWREAAGNSYLVCFLIAILSAKFLKDKTVLPMSGKLVPPTTCDHEFDQPDLPCAYCGKTAEELGLDCRHDEHDHGICLDCGKDITDDLVGRAEAAADARHDR